VTGGYGGGDRRRQSQIVAVEGPQNDMRVEQIIAEA
jgi:hypothetical protein